MTALPLFVSYADIVFTPKTCEKIISEGADGVAIGVDSKWKMRLGAQETEIRKNMVFLDNGYVKDIGFLPLSENPDGDC